MLQFQGMKQKHLPSESKFNPGLLTLIAILLTFLLALVFIWLWYDLKNNSLEKQKPTTAVQATR
jgi:hypothetical protein